MAPEGIKNLLVWLKNTYDDPEIIVTENGYSDYGEMEDKDRVNYYRVSLSSLN